MANREQWERSTRRVHFVCGAILGALLGLRIGWDWLSSDRWWLGALVPVVLAFGCGALAWQHLDDFWHALLQWFGR
jgi:di/tricarboxylate transporter